MKQAFYAALVLAAPMLAQVTINPSPAREFGQPNLQSPPLSAAPNLVEGKELFSPTAIAFDSSVTPPHVYVVDTGNNRVLGWNNANNVAQGNFADLVIGQQSLFATFPEGVGTSFSTGLNTPTGIAVDPAGNVYIADSGNNRILRFKTPFKQQAGNLVVDLVIGQKTVGSGALANQGQQNPSASSLYFFVGNPYPAGGVISAGLAIDGSGNLWSADPGNNRVLRFPVASLAPNTQLPTADLVIGQNTFISSQLPQNQAQTNLGFLGLPTSLALDAGGNLYVADVHSRVVQYLAPLSLGESGSKVLGLPPPLTAGQTLTYPTSSTLGSINAAANSFTGSAQGVFILNGAQGSSVFVSDSNQNRVVRYDTFAGTWNIQSPALSPVQNGVVGQPDSVSGKANQGLTSPTNQTLAYPSGGAIRADNGEMWLVDELNHRVVAFANQGGAVYNTASRVIGQTDFIYNGANLLDGREFWFNAAPTFSGAGIVVDTQSTPPHLYVADSLNHRILGFKDARNVGTDSRNLLTQKADLVIGQTDLLHNLINSPSNSPLQPNATGLNRPVGLALDANGNLWVADSGNGRAVRFPAPFAQAPNSVPTANMVLGQADFNSLNQSVTQFNMIQPFGIALLANGSLAVSDPGANRVLVFYRPSGGDFSIGAPADLVVGQTNFNQFGPGNGNNQFNSPRHIAVDSSDRLFVCDPGNSRMLVFSKPTANNPTAALNVPGLNNPQGVIVSIATGLSWVTSTNSNLIYQLPEFDVLQSTLTPTQTLQAYFPLAVALDGSDNLIVADSANRVTFYFGQLFYRNTANYTAGGNGSGAGPTPTMLAALARLGNPFKLTPSYSGGNVQNMGTPWPLSLNNLQVQVNGIPSPIFRIDPSAIYVEIPNSAPTAGPADFVVSNPATGEILAIATFTMQSDSPALYTANSGGTGQAAVSVYDSKNNYVGVNSTTTPVQAGNLITLWLTGAGNVPGLPADGTAGTQGVPTPIAPTVFINSEIAKVIGSAMSPQFPGLWQINVFVPSDTPPSTTVGPISVVVSMNDYFSNFVGTNQPNGSPGLDQKVPVSNSQITTIYVK